MRELLSLLDDARLLKLVTLLRQANNVVLCAHRSPDGDATGACLAWADYLRGLHKKVSIILPNPFPDFLRWLPNNEKILFYDHKREQANQLVKEADLICCLDFNDLRRILDLGQAVEKSKAALLVIDHHLFADEAEQQTLKDLPAEQLLSFPELSSTCEIVFRLVCQLGGYDDMTKSTAACLYTGMMTDTGAFTYNSSRPEVYQVISLLLERGIDKDKIYRNVYNNYSVDRLRLEGYILYDKLQFYANNRASIFTLTREEMQRFHFKRGDAEGIVNMPLQVKGMRLSISLREDTERDVIRVSLRSVDDFPCNKMAQTFFNGGGHLNASGGELACSLADAIKKAEEAIEAFSNLL